MFSDLLNCDARVVEYNPVISGLVGDVGDNEAEVLWTHVCVDGVSVRILCGTADAIRCEQDSSLEYEVVSVSATHQSVKEGLVQVADHVLLSGSW